MSSIRQGCFNYTNLKSLFDSAAYRIGNSQTWSEHETSSDSQTPKICFSFVNVSTRKIHTSDAKGVNVSTREIHTSDAKGAPYATIDPITQIKPRFPAAV